MGFHPTKKRPPVAFELGQVVVVRDADIRARVDAVQFDFDGIQYRIHWWAEGQRQCTWVHAVEIEPVQREKVIQGAA